MDFRNTLELIGIFAVVLSLVFVGLELQQSSAIARMEARQNYITPLSEQLREMSQNSELASLIASTYDEDRAISDFSRTEFAQIQTGYASALLLSYGVFIAAKENILDDDDLALVSGYAGIYDTNMFRFMWFGGRLTGSFSDDFIQYFESLSWNNNP